jgi:hypothetical protein
MSISTTISTIVVSFPQTQPAFHGLLAALNASSGAVVEGVAQERSRQRMCIKVQAKTASQHQPPQPSHLQPRLNLEARVPPLSWLLFPYLLVGFLLHAGNKRPAGCRKVLLVLYRLFVYGSFIPLLFKEGLQKNSPFFTDGQTAYSFVPGLAVVFFVGADSTLNR